jgi:hypothetical protein
VGLLALTPAAVAFPLVLVLTFYLCVGRRRVLALAAAGALPLGAIAIYLDTGGAHGTCDASCLGRQDAAPVAWWLALSWLLAVLCGGLLGTWRDRVAARTAPTSSPAAAAPRGA